MLQKRPQVGIGVIVRNDRQLLLMRRSNSHGAGTWSSPGGHLEYGETPEACALRETLEETGVTITNVTFRTITNDFFEDEGKHYVTIWMEGDYLSGEPFINSARELTAVGWFPWDVLPQPLFLPLKNLLSGQYASFSEADRLLSRTPASRPDSYPHLFGKA